MPCRRPSLTSSILCLLLLMGAPLPGYAQGSGHAQGGEFLYDARMAFLKAGELALNLERNGETYQVGGEFKTSRALSPYYSWNGVFAAVGQWRPFGGPKTTAYMSRTTSKDHDLRIVLTYPDATRILDKPGEEFETVERPGGIDLISALFFSPDCYSGGLVHDGEDSYQLTLNKERSHRFNGGRHYYKGDVVSCDYVVTDYKARKRRVIVSMADVAGTRVAVQVRAKIPLLPDAVFRLRTSGMGRELAQAH